MTAPAPSLKVTPVGLRAEAQHCTTLAGQVAGSVSSVAASGWQSSGAGANAVGAGAGKAGTVLKSHLTTCAGKLTRAATHYQNQDEHGAATLSQLPFDGGVGDAGAIPPELFTADAGADGGIGDAGADDGAAALGAPN